MLTVFSSYPRKSEFFFQHLSLRTAVLKSFFKSKFGNHLPSIIQFLGRRDPLLTISWLKHPALL